MTEEQPKQRKPRRKELNRLSMRKLPQFAKLTEEEFDQKFNTLLISRQWDEALKEKFDAVKRQFQESYDLTELLPNDNIVLDNLIRAMLFLENYEKQLHNLQKEGVSHSNLDLVKEINGICKDLRNDISKMQDDLNITRRRRKNEKEASVINFIEDLKEKARKFYTQKMQMIFCEKCNTLLSTVWWLNVESKKQTIHVRCERKLDDGKICGWEKTFTAEQLTQMGMRNKEDIPDSIK